MQHARGGQLHFIEAEVSIFTIQNPHELAMDSVVVVGSEAAAFSSPRHQYHFGIGAQLQREPALGRDLAFQDGRGLVLRVLSVCSIIPLCSIRAVQPSPLTDVPVQLHTNGPAFRSHAIDIGDTILEIDGASSWVGRAYSVS